jgi:hypothetical protein
MGKASSSKKVARAARAGSTHKGPERRELGFPLAVAVTVLLGSSLVLYARSDGSTAVEPKIGTHWHAAYGIYNCDHWEAPAPEVKDDPHGIHTHDADNTPTGGIMHIHPFDSSAAGANAKFKVFFDTVGIKSSNAKIEFPNGVTLENGAKCGDKPGVLQVVRFDADNTAATSVTVTKDFSNVRYRKDREAFTIALVPEGTPVPPPTQETLDKLNLLSDVGSASGATGSGATGTGSTATSGASGTGASGDSGASGASGSTAASGASGSGASGSSGSSTTVASSTPTTTAP